MKRLFAITSNGKRKFIFLKDKYGHNRVNIGLNPKVAGQAFHLGAMEIRLLCEDGRFDQNAFIHDDRILFNGLSWEDLSPEEFAIYQEDVLGVSPNKAEYESKASLAREREKSGFGM